MALLTVIRAAMLAAGFLLPWIPVLLVLVAAIYVVRRIVLRGSNPPRADANLPKIPGK
jgi:hypothetical protein